MDYEPVSDPFVKRLIGTICRGFFEQVLVWNSVDPERKLCEFQHYYNEYRVHASLGSNTPAQFAYAKSNADRWFPLAGTLTRPGSDFSHVTTETSKN